MTEAPPLTLDEQADLIKYLLSRCVKRSGAVAAETWMLIDAKDHADLMHLEARLRRMAPHEREIKKVVMRK